MNSAPASGDLPGDEPATPAGSATGGQPHRGWEYATAGDYHRQLDPNWSYTPTYLRKMRHVRQGIDALPPNANILDAGCGEGVLVEEYRHLGRQIEGLDLNYESEFVRRGDVLALPYADGTFDAALLLDALEHLAYADQPRALAELYRVLTPGGRLLLTAPNLAHLNSRSRLLWRGRLDRTDTDLNHIGERPLDENRALLRAAGFHIQREIGITLTIPIVYRQIICRWPAAMRWLHDAMEPAAVRLPSLAMITFFECAKARGAGVTDNARPSSG